MTEAPSTGIGRVFREVGIIIGISLALSAIGLFVLNVPMLLAHKAVSTGNVQAAASHTATEPTLYVPAIGVQAPIIFSQSVRDTDVLEDLKKGLSHQLGTAMPGEQGNVFIVGHSSNYPWEHGSYNTVFSFLNKLQNGDIAYIDYKGKRYEYVATAKKIVSPQDLSVTNGTPGHNLSLMSCYPTGTTLKRVVVIFDLKATYE